jgi:hypothetical protein
MELLKRKSLNTEEPIVYTDCQKSILIDSGFIDLTSKSTSDIYDVFYTNNSTREIFEDANKTQIVTTPTLIQH